MKINWRLLFEIFAALWTGVIWGVNTNSVGQGAVIFLLTFWIIDIYLDAK